MLLYKISLNEEIKVEEEIEIVKLPLLIIYIKKKV